MEPKRSFFCLFTLVIYSLTGTAAGDPHPGSPVKGYGVLQDTVPEASEHYQTKGVEGNLPVFYENLGSRLTFPMSWTSGKYDDFSRWKQMAREKVMECVMYHPPEVPFSPVVIDQEQRDGYVAQKVVFNLSADSRVMGYMLIPDGKGPFPAVLLLHDHGGRFDIGKEKMIRPFHDSIRRMESAREWVETNYSGRFVGDELAKKGYVCFATDALNWGDRGGGGYEGQQALASNLMYLGSSLAGVMAYEDMRAAAFLAGNPRVDPANVVALGHSMGGFRAWQVAALSEYITAGVAVCWMATVKGLASPGNNLTRGNSSYNMLHPGIHNYLDFPDIASMACPKPMLFYNGLRDHLSPVNSVEDAYRKMHAVWDSQQAGPQLETQLWDYGHIFNAEMQEGAFQWMEAILK
ncbi:MAG: dienelactone hydrolase family protein [Bacteroidales bacterium]